MEKKSYKTPSESESYLAEIVGEESLMGQRLGAGKMLHLMDLAAANAAWKHARCPLVTLSFDRIELLNMICHMDYVRYDAYVTKVGNSSMVVKVDGFCKSPTEMDIYPTHSGFITMVAIDENKKPNRNIPGLNYSSPKDFELKTFAEHREIAINERKNSLAHIKELTTISNEQLVDYYERQTQIPIDDTQLKIQKVFLPKNANILGIVFGGETIELMEELALATARQFTGNFQMVTIAMEDVYFLKPLNLNNLVEMTAIVTFIAHTTLTVEVSVRIFDVINPDVSHTSNKGTFTILNYDRSGRKRPIKTGLDLTNGRLDAKKCYLQEQKKYEVRKAVNLERKRKVCE